MREQLPERGLFNDVYADFENTAKELCLTHVMLKVEAAPKCFENYMNEMNTIINHKDKVIFVATKADMFFYSRYMFREVKSIYFILFDAFKIQIL